MSLKIKTQIFDNFQIIQNKFLLQSFYYNELIFLIVGFFNFIC